MIHYPCPTHDKKHPEHSPTAQTMTDDWLKEWWAKLVNANPPTTVEMRYYRRRMREDLRAEMLRRGFRL